MRDFDKGDRVKVEFEGTVRELTNVNGSGYHLGHCAIVTDDLGTEHAIYAGASGRVVTKMSPASWPPRHGDVWEANDISWFACGSVLDAEGLIMRPVRFDIEDNSTCSPADFRKKRGVKLAYRRGL